MRKQLLKGMIACVIMAAYPALGGITAMAQSQPAAQTSTCTGTVTDSNGDPAVGVTVKVKGESSGTMTDIDGHFTITSIKKGATIEFSGVGFKPVSKVWTGQPLEIKLEDDVTSLDEVVVVGYGVQKKVNLSGAVATVDTKKLESRPVLNVGQALQGTVANLNVSIGSGQANDSPSYNIRGTTSLNGGSPLIVIDGVVASPWMLNNMNPNDIESISVLKDASSAAIYGSRAAFGVILVTTKNGKSEKLSVSYTGNVTLRQNTHKPKIITDPYIIAQTRNVMSYPWYNLYDEQQLDYAKQVSENPGMSPYYENPDGTYSYFGQTDWVKEAYKKTAMTTGHNLSISGKTNRVDYLLSGGYNYTDGIVKYGTDKYNRFNLRNKLNFHLTDWWTLGSNIGLIFTDYDSPSNLGSSFYWNIYRSNTMDVIYNPDGTWTKTGGSNFANLLEGGEKNVNGLNISTVFTTKIDILKDVLWVNGNFSYTFDRDRTRGSYLPYTYYDGPATVPVVNNSVTSAFNESSQYRRFTYDAYATFNKKFANLHSVTVMAGFNQENYRSEYTYLSRKELITSSLPTPGLATGDMNLDESISTWAVRSGYARVNYGFDDKYLIEFSGRYDGTSRFPKKDRYTFNPSGSAAWVFTRESFMESLSPVLSFGKIRYSYGTLGNQDVSTYAYIATMGSGKTSFILDGKQPVYVGAPGLVSGALTWEKVTTSNIGLDLNFFNNRLSLSGDIYTRWTKDMLTSGQPLPGVLGTSVPQENAADLKTNGWDLTIGWNDSFRLAGKPFNYSASFVLSDYVAKITKFDNPTGSLGSYYVGRTINEIWGWTTEGFFTSEEDIKNHADQSLLTSYPGTRDLEPGDLKFADLNGDGVLNNGNSTMIKLNGQYFVKGDPGYEEALKNPDATKVATNSVENHGDKKIIGNSTPRYRFGLNLSAEWNNFDLSLFLQGIGKRDYDPSGDLYFWGIYAQPWTNVTYGNYYDRWTPETPDGYFPRMKAYVAEQSSYEAGLTQTRYLQNAAYVRLKNLTFGYTIPASVTSRAGIERVRVYFTGENLFTHSGLYKHYNVDPEALGGQSYPLQRYFSFGLNVAF
ncbi:MAG: TonB-dependent receptor [Paramuribaculum sp.]|nr:TonB-dependent receptor [Bacteroides sp.]MBD5375528.1 TonB-dependent receptor [Bacteroides sp.]MDE7461363.1 TonB-dependent receptor [Paramuribaculum sp.]